MIPGLGTKIPLAAWHIQKKFMKMTIIRLYHRCQGFKKKTKTTVQKDSEWRAGLILLPKPPASLLQASTILGGLSLLPSIFGSCPEINPMYTSLSAENSHHYLKVG